MMELAKVKINLLRLLLDKLHSGESLTESEIEIGYALVRDADIQKLFDYTAEEVAHVQGNSKER